MKIFKFLMATFFLALVISLAAAAQDSTTVTVRALAKDAKFIGSSMDGMMITIVESSTGDTLARGLTEGGTGDTERLVKVPVGRYEKLSTPGAAKFEADLWLQEPTLVTISAIGPQSLAQAQVTVTTQQWLIPGRDITGDGIILDVPGFAITNQLPKSDKTYRIGQPVPIKSHIAMMCGCPTSDGGLWDSSKYEIRAQVKRDGKIIKTMPLYFTGEASLFDASFTPAEAGTYKVLVYAFHPETGNSGVAKTTVSVE